MTKQERPHLSLRLEKFRGLLQNRIGYAAINGNDAVSIFHGLIIEIPSPNTIAKITCLAIITYASAGMFQ